jgi:hypothetical protein
MRLRRQLRDCWAPAEEQAWTLSEELASQSSSSRSSECRGEQFTAARSHSVEQLHSDVATRARLGRSDWPWLESGKKREEGAERHLSHAYLDERSHRAERPMRREAIAVAYFFYFV